MQTQVQTRRCAGRGQDLTFVDVEDVGVQFDRWVGGPEHIGAHPVRRGAFAVEDAGIGQGERSRTDGSDPNTVGVGRFQCCDDRIRDAGDHVVATWNHDRVHACKRIQSIVRCDADRAGIDDRFTTADLHAIARSSVGQSGAAEHLNRGGQIECHTVGQRDDGNTVHGLAIYRRNMAIVPLFCAVAPRQHWRYACPDRSLRCVRPA